LAIFLITWLSAGPITAQEPELTFKKLAIFPFAVLSKTPREYLGEKVRQDFEARLKADGFTVVPQEELNKEISGLKEPLDDNQAKDIARRLGADAAITGQVVIVGEAVALEGRILDLPGQQAPATVKLQGTGCPPSLRWPASWPGRRP
jgi:TolB-like protein